MFVYNKSSKYVHKEDCKYVDQMNKENKKFPSMKQIEEAPIELHFCSYCLPDGLDTNEEDDE